MPEELRVLQIYYDSLRNQEILTATFSLSLILVGAIMTRQPRKNRRALALALVGFGLLGLFFSLVGFFGLRHEERGGVYYITENPGSICAIEAFHLRPRSVNFTPQIATLLTLSALGLLLALWSRRHRQPHLEGLGFAMMIVFLLFAANEIPARNAAIHFRNNLIAIGCGAPAP